MVQYAGFYIHKKFKKIYVVTYIWPTLIQYRGEAKDVSGNTVGCSLELPGLCLGQYLPPGRSNFPNKRSAVLHV